MTKKKNANTIVDTANPHTIKKFELIEEYVKAWAQKLLNFPECRGIVFIDCMCNSGVYNDNAGNGVIGTPIRVANYLRDIMPNYPSKQAWLYFNDLSLEKIALLKTRLPENMDNFHISTLCGDGNDLLKNISIERKENLNYLLIYDPYQASVDWSALAPFLRKWGEVIINHMVYDSIRGISQAKTDVVIAKYEQTYLSDIKDLATFGNDRNAYEKRIQEIITALKGSSGRQYFIASFPFFNTRNGLVYNLIHCGGNIEGFKLFKRTAWKTFGGKSSTKDTHGEENQLVMDLDGSGEPDTITDEYCYYVMDIVKYLHDRFDGRRDVPLDEVWGALDEHPIFPSEGYKPEIKKALKEIYHHTVSTKTISFIAGGR